MAPNLNEDEPAGHEAEGALTPATTRRTLLGRLSPFRKTTTSVERLGAKSPTRFRSPFRKQKATKTELSENVKESEQAVPEPNVNAKKETKSLADVQSPDVAAAASV